MHRYHFRTATAADAPSISVLVNAAYRPAAGAEGWTHESALIAGARTNPAQVTDLLHLPHSAVLLACDAQQQIHGCVHVEAHGDQTHIGLLAVTPGLQDRGLGKQLLAQAEHLAAERFAASMLLLTVVRARQELRAFYLRRGYLPNGATHAYPVHAGVGQPHAGELLLEVLVKPAPALAAK
jgi:GNAT superfamily N-acetyltransferase